MNNQPESDEECFITQVVPPPKKNYPPYKRARVEYEDFNIEQVAGDGHCIVKCFARRFCKDTDVVLQLLTLLSLGGGGGAFCAPAFSFVDNFLHETVMWLKFYDFS